MGAAATYQIRPVLRAEAPVWRALRAEMLKNHPTAFSSAYEDFVLRTDEEVAARIPEIAGPDTVFGVWLDGALCGSAGFARERDRKLAHKGAMWGVYVRPALRGTGAARALVGTVIDHARAHADVLLAVVNAENLAAKALYHRLGFRTYGIEPRALRWDGRDYDEELLVLEFDRCA
ncbi:MAG: GNAT family N-acetyltransferase [Caulobacteraceae bacterium]|nr:GNAT family N-acetyltransferase [Caulobacteraceae bacterium]